MKDDSHCQLNFVEGIDFSLIEKQLLAAFIGFGPGALVRLPRVNSVLEVLEIQRVNLVKLRCISDGEIYYENPILCKPVTALEALGDQAE